MERDRSCVVCGKQGVVWICCRRYYCKEHGEEHECEQQRQWEVEREVDEEIYREVYRRKRMKELIEF